MHDRISADHARRAGEEKLKHTASQDELVDGVLAREQARRLRARLRALPESQRVVVVLAYYGELTLVEIADHLGVPLAIVEERLRIAIEGLREAWGPPST